MQINIEKSNSSGEASLPRFPSTRYQGSKRKILPLMSQIFENLEFKTALDLYSGSGMITLLLRHMGKDVCANDYLLYNKLTAELFLTAKGSHFDEKEFVSVLNFLLNEAAFNQEKLVSINYKNIFFTDSENLQIDRLCQNLYTSGLTTHKIRIIVYCVGQSLLMKRPYNLFRRANLQMRTKKVVRSFGNAKTWETDIATHSLKLFKELANFPYPENVNGEASAAFGENTSNLNLLPSKFDLIYLDPPYLNSRGVGLKYTDFYHFLDGLCDYSLFSKGDKSVTHMPIVQEKSAWTSRRGAVDEMQRVIDRWRSPLLVVSYRSDGVPSENEMLEILSSGGRSVNLHAEVSYKYALSNSASTKEQVIISRP